MKRMTIGLLVAVLLLMSGTVLVSLAWQGGGNLPPTIIDFSVDLPSITVDAAEAGETSATLAWHTVGMTEQYQLWLQSYMLDRWVAILEDDSLEPTGTRSIPVLHPANFGPPTYRLLIVDGQAQVLDERIAIIPYDAESVAGAPTIEMFTTDIQSVEAGALAQGNVRIVVSWEVVNRLPASNLVFEEVLEDGRAVSVELPRSHLWVGSAGQGAVAPVLPAAQDVIRLRLRVASMADGRIFDERELTVRVIGSVVTATPVWVGTPTPLPAGLPSEGLAVISFTASPDIVDRGGTVTLGWEVVGTNSVSVSRLNPVGQYVDFISDQPVIGSWTVTLPEYYVDSAPFQLMATDASGTRADAFVRVQVRCPYAYFFGEPESEACPLTEPMDVPAAFQPFEGGYMIWRGDTREIYVLNTTAQPRLGRYRDTWTEGDVGDIGASPPSGFYQPVRGFGKVWSENPAVRQSLGWATAPEQSYTARIQESGAYRYARTYFTWPSDERVLYIVENTWGFGG
jgi:hypothetical protein